MVLIAIHFVLEEFKKWYNVTVLAGALSFKECDQNIKWKILHLKSKMAYYELWQLYSSC